MTGGFGQDHPANWINPASGRTYSGGVENQDITADYPAADLIGKRPVTETLNPTQFSTANPVTPPTQAHVVAALGDTGQAIQHARQGIRATGTQLSQAITQGAQARAASIKDAKAARDASFNAMLAQAKAPTSPAPASPATAPAPSAGPSSSFGPGHPFYATLNGPSPAPTSAPAASAPRMPSTVPTAGLGNLNSSQFLASPGGKLLRSGVGKAVTSVGNVVASAAKPRSSPTMYSSGSGWRSR